MTTHGTLTPIHRDAAVAIAESRNPMPFGPRMTLSQFKLYFLAVVLQYDMPNLPRWARKS